MVEKNNTMIIVIILIIGVCLCISVSASAGGVYWWSTNSDSPSPSSGTQTPSVPSAPSAPSSPSAPSTNLTIGDIVSYDWMPNDSAGYFCAANGNQGVEMNAIGNVKSITGSNVGVEWKYINNPSKINDAEEPCDGCWERGTEAEWDALYIGSNTVNPTVDSGLKSIFPIDSADSMLTKTTSAIPECPVPVPVKTCTLVNAVGYIRPSGTSSDAMFDNRVPNSIKSEPYSQWTQTADVCRNKCVEAADCQEWAWYSGGNACYRVNTLTGNSSGDGGYTSGRCTTA